MRTSWVEQAAAETLLRQRVDGLILTTARLPVPLTTVRVPFDRIAAHAVDLLVQQRTDTLGETLAVAPPTLIPRRSTARPARPS